MSNREILNELRHQTGSPRLELISCVSNIQHVLNEGRVLDIVLSERLNYKLSDSLENMRQCLRKLDDVITSLEARDGQSSKFDSVIDEFQHLTGSYLLNINSGIRVLQRATETGRLKDADISTNLKYMVDAMNWLSERIEKVQKGS